MRGDQVHAAPGASADDRGVLRFLTCGSVDDGKSTLIGRLLYDTKTLLSDTLATLEKNARRRGLSAPDLSLLTDGLVAEREQGITIDVAYRYFATARRKFIIGDSPGHVQYTRNMVTAASTADAAVLLVDARKGIIAQTRRHATIVGLLGCAPDRGSQQDGPGGLLERRVRVDLLGFSRVARAAAVAARADRLHPDLGAARSQRGRARRATELVPRSHHDRVARASAGVRGRYPGAVTTAGPMGLPPDGTGLPRLRRPHRKRVARAQRSDHRAALRPHQPRGRHPHRRARTRAGRGRTVGAGAAHRRYRHLRAAI